MQLLQVTKLRGITGSVDGKINIITVYIYIIMQLLQVTKLRGITGSVDGEINIITVTRKEVGGRAWSCGE